MTELCEHWRTWQVGESVLSDVYDGEVWKNLSGEMEVTSLVWNVDMD